MTTLVKGKVVFDEVTESFSDATVYIRLQDVSHIDASSKTVATSVMHQVSVRADEENSFPFSIEGELPDRKGHYNVAVHVDVDNDGRKSKGDFITVQSYPVLTFGYPNEVTVHVVQI